MWRHSLSVVGCPKCFGPLLTESTSEVIEEGDLICDHDGLEFPVHGGIPDLILPDHTGRADGFARSYDRSWSAHGPGAFQPSQFTTLPFVPLASKGGWAWRVKARSMTALLEFLDERPPKRVLDFGCGVGWLSYRLAAHGYETFGVDIRREGPSGLEAARGYLGLGAGFECIRGEMERPPFQDGRFDLIVANASIHFSRSLPESFAQVLRLLVPGGVFVMMNSPVHKDPTSARRAEGDAQRNLIRLGSSPEMAASYRHFSRAEVEKAFRDAFGSVTELRWDPGLAFRLVRRTKSVLLRMELASFPIYEGRAAEPVRARDVSHRESLRLIDDPAGGA